ncbi:hypothetical protein BGZ73_000219 [Actinomortierella ambigua]|nr:hypothetical protein BGZ73_000219 [Actinomortierella ambigua]
MMKNLPGTNAVLFLGDLLDGGRETVNDQATYFKNVERFHRIFQTAQTAYNVRPIVQYTNQRPPEQDSRSGERDHANLQGNHSNNVDKGAVLTDLERENGRSFYQLAKPVPTTREEREQVRGAGKSLRLYVAGNHDIGIGDTTIPAAVRLYQDEFGPLNYEIDLGHHRLVTLDTLTLNAAKGSPVRVEAQHLLDHVARPDMQDSSPRILFTHVPLYRPPQTYCGAERQTTLSIEQGRGYQYQNLVEAELSQEILEKVQPTMILSGDDHDWCGVAHPTMKSGDSSNRLVDMIPEVTVPTFSFAQINDVFEKDEIVFEHDK